MQLEHLDLQIQLPHADKVHLSNGTKAVGYFCAKLPNDTKHVVFRMKMTNNNGCLVFGNPYGLCYFYTRAEAHMYMLT